MGLFWGSDPPGQVCGPMVKLYTGSYCVADNVWQAVEDALYEGFTGYIECMVSVHEKAWTYVAMAGSGCCALSGERLKVWPKTPGGFGRPEQKHKFTSSLSKFESWLRQKGFVNRGNMLRGHARQVKMHPISSGVKTCGVAVLYVELAVTWHCSSKAFKFRLPEFPVLITGPTLF